MDRIRIGRVFRALRREQRLRQSDVAARAGVCQQTVSRLERGEFGSLSIDALCSLACAVGAELPLMPQWRGPGLARLLDRRHAALQNVVAEQLASLGWAIRSEFTFNFYGDRGSVDLLAWFGPAKALLIIETKTEIVSLEELLRALDIKARVVPGMAARDLDWRPNVVGVVLVLPEGSTWRDFTVRHRPLLRGSLPAGNVEIGRWLRHPDGALGGVWFVRDTHGESARAGRPPAQRVRMAKSAAGASVSRSNAPVSAHDRPRRAERRG